MADKLLDEKEIFNRARQIAAPDERLASFKKPAATIRRPCTGSWNCYGSTKRREASWKLPRLPQITTIDAPIAECPGTIIGPYKLLEQIGEGGFGLVFMAEQQQPVRRKVALKVLKPGMDTRQVDRPLRGRAAGAGAHGPSQHRQGARCRRDRRRAGLLRHGAGQGRADHRLLRSEPPDAHEQRLELFVPVCQAVQHAHHKGIIHRDLKPSNVLVTLHDGEPVVKVIDFGVAKALGQQLTDKTLFTGFAQMVGTPLYMSPEQAQLSGLDIDTRSDIYSLGVLLYELLDGHDAV